MGVSQRPAGGQGALFPELSTWCKVSVPSLVSLSLAVWTLCLHSQFRGNLRELWAGLTLFCLRNQCRPPEKPPLWPSPRPGQAVSTGSPSALVKAPGAEAGQRRLPGDLYLPHNSGERTVIRHTLLRTRGKATCPVPQGPGSRESRRCFPQREGGGHVLLKVQQDFRGHRTGNLYGTNNSLIAL